jgi:hypothetical protein
MPKKPKSTRLKAGCGEQRTAKGITYYVSST